MDTAKQTSIDCQITQHSFEATMEINEQYAAIIVKRGLESKDKSDKIFLVSGTDGQKVPIHRFILSAASERFADLLHGNDGKIGQPQFLLAYSDGESIKTVVDYCYSGNIVLTEQNAVKCLQIAVNEDFDLLLEECQEYFSSQLSIDNAVQVLTIAYKHDIVDLWQAALELIGSQIDKVSMADIVQLNYLMMQRLLETGENKELIAERLIKWFQHDEDKRGVHMPRMLRLIRLDQLTMQFLGEMFEPLFVRFECFDLLVKEYKRRAIQHSACTSSSNSRPPSPVDNAPPKSAPLQTVQSSQMENDDMKSIFIVIESFDMKLTVDRYDKSSLNRLTRHFTSPTMDIFGFGTVLYANKLFVIGGQRNDRIYEILGSMIAYDMSTGKDEKLASMNEPRFGFTAIVMEKWIYVFGGNESLCSTCERYDTETDKWETIKSMNRIGGIVSAAILNEAIYVASTDLINRVTLLESYDPKTNEWTVRMSLDVGRYGSQLVAFNDILYGFVDSKFRRYDSEQDEWSETNGRLLFRNFMRVGVYIQEMIAVDDSLFAITSDATLLQAIIDENEMEMVIGTVANVPSLSGIVTVHRMGLIGEKLR